jgi:hypothetical protein
MEFGGKNSCLCFFGELVAVPGHEVWRKQLPSHFLWRAINAHCRFQVIISSSLSDHVVSQYH